MVRVWQQTENNRLAEDFAILQRDIGAVKEDEQDYAVMQRTYANVDALPSSSCPSFCVEEIKLAEQVINALHVADLFSYRLGEAIMARMRLEEKLANAVG